MFRFKSTQHITCINYNKVLYSGYYISKKFYTIPNGRNYSILLPSCHYVKHLVVYYRYKFDFQPYGFISFTCIHFFKLFEDKLLHYISLMGKSFFICSVVLIGRSINNCFTRISKIGQESFESQFTGMFESSSINWSASSCRGM